MTATDESASVGGDARPPRTAKTYRLACTRCRFEDEVEGLHDALDAAATHEAVSGAAHFAEVVMVDPDGEADHETLASAADARVNYPQRL